MFHNPRDVRLDYGSPANILGSVPVGVDSEPTRLALEVGLRAPVGFLAMPATIAGSRSVSGINQYHRHARNRRLVRDELSQLKERPGVMLSSLTLGNRCPISDAAQILKRNSSSGVFGASHQLLGDAVVLVCRVPGFAALPLLQQELRGFRAFGLNLRAQVSAVRPKRVQGFSAVGVPIAVRSDLDDAKVNPKVFAWVNRGFFVNLDHDAQVELSVRVQEVGLAANSVHPRGLIATHQNGDQLPSFKRQDRDLLESFPRENPLVVGNCAERVERTLGFLVQLVRFNHFAHGTNRHLAREAKPFAHVVVGGVVKLDLIEGAGAEGDARNVVARGVKAPHGLKQFLCLVPRWIKFHFKRHQHVTILAYLERFFQGTDTRLEFRQPGTLRRSRAVCAPAARTPFLPIAEARGFQGVDFR
jgi:hypothetical protein